MYGVSDFDKPTSVLERRTPLGSSPSPVGAPEVSVASHPAAAVAQQQQHQQLIVPHAAHQGRRGAPLSLQKKERTGSLLFRNWKLKAIVLVIVLGQIYLLTKYSGWTSPVKMSENEGLPVAFPPKVVEEKIVVDTSYKDSWTPGVDWSKYENMSIVYTWVNGSEPDYRELRARVGGSDKVGGSRDRDNDELKYSIRSLEAHLPWHKGTIYIVTPGMWPRWLNWTHPRIRLVNQDDLIPVHKHKHRHVRPDDPLLLKSSSQPAAAQVNGNQRQLQAFWGDEEEKKGEEEHTNEEVEGGVGGGEHDIEDWDPEDAEDQDEHQRIPLEPPPTFNTNVIEQFLWTIPGLTEQYIQLNDDYFFGGRWDPEDFFTPEGGVRFFYTHNRVPVDAKRMKDIRSKRKIWLASLYNTMIAIAERYPQATNELYSLKHAPYVYHRDAWAWVHKLFRPELKTSLIHPFRHYEDILNPYLHHAFVTYEGSKWDDPPEGDDGVVGNLEAWTHGEITHPLIHKKFPYGQPRNPNSWDDRGNELGFCILTDDVGASQRCLNDWLKKSKDDEGLLDYIGLGRTGLPRFFTINDSFTKPKVAEILKEFLSTTFPKKSSFELTPDEAEEQYRNFKRMQAIKKEQEEYEKQQKEKNSNQN
eukprot:TRINITY_DN1821_c2_g1_i1.p1 TRINITY_DN1821_c2_g1~~TRINITY_DN1821_c2_g1_i1.p1  ORF type:complete len:647 (-),score=149.71 TRINITY_DN1821_c2_g1_i1:16-1935(-)